MKDMLITYEEIIQSALSLNDIAYCALYSAAERKAFKMVYTALAAQHEAGSPLWFAFTEAAKLIKVDRRLGK